MDGTNPKVSFIPKSSLVREVSFLDRPRPRSVMGSLAIFAFIATAGSYGGLYLYNDSLGKKIVAKTNEIKSTQKEFSDAPQVEKAKVFLSRVALARELLDTHILVSPVISFLSNNTVGSVVYDKFSFMHGANGETLELFGEAPSYASLAYQGDVLRGKTKELSNMSIHEVGLTKFGTVTFALTMTFNPGYLSYTRNLKISESATAQSMTEEIMNPISKTATSSASSTSSLTKLPASVATSTALGEGLPLKIVIVPRATSSVGMSTPSAQSVLRSLWTRFKFW